MDENRSHSEQVPENPQEPLIDEPSPREKTAASAADLEADPTTRHNTRGPSSCHGKLAVRHNACKHSLTARSPVVPGEDIREYREHINAVGEYWSPLGPVEEFLTQQIADGMWRLQRARRFETTEVTATIEAEQEAVRDTRNLRPSEFETTTAGIRKVLTILAKAEAELNESGKLSDTVVEQLTFCCCGSPHLAFLDSENPSSQDILKAVVNYRGYLKTLCPKIKARERKLSKTIKGLNSIPTEETLGRLHRYETTIRRQLERDIRMLLLLQAQRHERKEGAD